VDVLIAPSLDDDLRFLQAVQDLLVQTLVATPAVELLAVAVLPWITRLDVERSATKPDPVILQMPAAGPSGSFACL
jgi:hypothetical protein